MLPPAWPRSPCPSPASVWEGVWLPPLSLPRADMPLPRIVVSGSLAFDYIMNFPGSIQDFILPEKVHVLSVSFLFDSLVRFRGGVAGNVAYSLALLGEPPMLVGGGGADFGAYRAEFERLGIDMRLVVQDDAMLTGSSFMMSDLAGNQIAGFYPGAAVRAADVSVTEAARAAVIGVVGPTSLETMRRHAEEISAAGCRLVFDPSQQVVAMPGDDLRAGIAHAWAVVGSDYEFAVMEQKTGLSVEAIAERVEVTVVTFGGEGSEIRRGGAIERIPVAPPEVVVDPTGGGDAYRAGLLKGLLRGLPMAVVGRMAALAATYAIERHGTQEHRYGPEGFVERFDRAFPECAGTLDPDWLRSPVGDEALAIERLPREDA